MGFEDNEKFIFLLKSRQREFFMKEFTTVND
jgi:hypothetical protein